VVALPLFYNGNGYHYTFIQRPKINPVSHAGMAEFT